jgi:DNA-binding transcriptional ArsR family regulator
VSTDLLSPNRAAATALGDGTRQAILELLAERPRPVGELAARLPVSRPAVSLHLKVLKDARLVRATAVGTRRVYELDADGLELLRTYLDRLWAGALTRFASAAEAAHAADLAAAEPSRSPSTSRTPAAPRRRRTPNKEKQNP